MAWKSALRRAIIIAGSQRKLAALCGVSQNAIWAALNRGRRVMPELAAKIAVATEGRVSVERLSPPRRPRKRSI